MLIASNTIFCSIIAETKTKDQGSRINIVKGSNHSFVLSQASQNMDKTLSESLRHCSSYMHKTIQVKLCWSATKSNLSSRNLLTGQSCSIWLKNLSQKLLRTFREIESSIPGVLSQT